MTKKAWMFTNTTKNKLIPGDLEKAEIIKKCQPLVDALKKAYIPENPDKRWNYLTDIYTKWSGKFFYFCQKYKSEMPDRIKDEFEENFVRLTYKGKDCYDFSYFRHTGQWFLVTINLTLEQCLEMMQDNPNFQPIS